MKILVLDPRGCDFYSDLYALDLDDGAVEKIQLGYVPELHYDASSRELVVVETELREFTGRETKYLLKCYDAGFNLTLQRETPERPMYAGYPGRSTRVFASPSGRYLYVLENRMVVRYPAADDVFGVTVHRYDRTQDTLTRGAFTVASCMLDFGSLGGDEDELYLHLSCDFPSTVVLGRFSSPDLEYLKVEDIPSRHHSPRETCGSWADRRGGLLFCVTGEGKVYQVRRHPAESTLLLKLPLAAPQSIPLHQIYGGEGNLFIGVSRDDNERSLSLASEIWQINIGERAVVQIITLPFPVVNFVTTPAADLLVGVSPYSSTLFLLDVRSGQVLEYLPDIGLSPAEVLLIP